jgi:hypothetical protein
MLMVVFYFNNLVLKQNFVTHKKQNHHGKQQVTATRKATLH